VFGAVRRAGKESLIYGIGQGLHGAVAFLLVPLYTRSLTQSDFGKFGLLAPIGAVVNVVISMGLTSAIFRSYFDYDDENDQKVVVSTTLILLIVTSLFITLIGVFLLPTLAQVLFDERSNHIFIWLVVLKAIAGSLGGIPLVVYRARGQAVGYSVTTLASSLLKVLVIIYLVVVKQWGLMGVLSGDAATAVAATAAMFYTIRDRIAPKFSWNEARKLLAFGLPLVPADLASMIFMRADLFFLNRYTDLSMVGQYNAAATVVTGIQMLVKTPLMLVWTPIVLSVEREGFAKKFYARMTTYVLTVTGLLVLSLSLFAPETIQVIGGAGYETAANVLPILCLSQVFYIIQIAFNVGITLKRKTQYVPFIIGIVAAVTLVTNYLLVPQVGVYGAAYAGLLSSIVFAVLIYSVSQRVYPIKYGWGRMSKTTVVFLLTYIIGSVPDGFLRGWSYLGLRLILLLLAPVLLLMWNFIEQDEIEAVKRQLGYIWVTVSR
jgi:O-antigen/teichoic acid export membrane protein